MECFASLLPRARFTWSRGRDDSLPIIITCVNDGEGSVGERRMGMADERTSSSRGAAARKGGGEIPFQLSNNDALPLHSFFRPRIYFGLVFGHESVAAWGFLIPRCWPSSWSFSRSIILDSLLVLKLLKYFQSLLGGIALEEKWQS